MRARTEIYAELGRPLAEVVGDKSAKDLAGLGLATVYDLLRHVPRRYLTGTESTDLATLEPGQEAAVVATVRTASVAGYGDKQRLEAVVTDGNGRLRLTFFVGRKKHLLTYWQGLLTPGERGIFVGKVGSFQGALQLTHPDFVMIDDAGEIIARANERSAAAGRRQSLAKAVQAHGLIGLYPASAKVPTWAISDAVNVVLPAFDALPDPLPAWVVTAARQPEFRAAIRAVHNPQDTAEAFRGIDRLIFDEAFATQLTMARRRREASAAHATPRPRRRDGLLAAFDARLPFTLTAGQREVGETIFADLARPSPMQRLLQGEVGSGKTLVALRAMLAVVDAGGQAALLAPTEVLAAQHARTLRAMLGDLAEGGTLAAADHATRVALLTGSLPAAQKKAALLEAASGEAGIVVGTHALLADRVQFADLGLIVVDEQHRFGVEQRAALAAKASAQPHVLVMTATPIPRSVAMTVFGDLATSALTEVPAGRSAVSTVVVDERDHPAWVERAWQRVREEVAAGRQAFIVAPRIGGADATGESVASEGASVVELHEQLTAGPLQGLRVGLLHGQLPPEEKDATMRAFAAGELDVLVATTVIEVGVDVPNASVMIICDADRFGISQLHQLRGRIGRGRHPGVCLLLTQADPASAARERLDAVAATRDGFALAQVDLEQRREGDVLGNAQAGGRSSLRLLRVTEHEDMIVRAREIATRAIERDPELADPLLADAVAQVEELAAGDFWERSG